MRESNLEATVREARQQIISGCHEKNSDVEEILRQLGKMIDGSVSASIPLDETLDLEK